MYALTMYAAGRERSPLSDNFQLASEAAAALERLDDDLGDHRIVDEFST